MDNDTHLGTSTMPLDVSLRPEEPGDEPFLFQVYAYTREAELALTNWDQATRLAFLNHQFAAMRSGYKSMFPTAEFRIILNAGRPVGRMVVFRNPEMIRVVDLAILPAQQGKGIGTHLIRQLQKEAASAGVPVALQVFQNNRAEHLYRKLGFEIISQNGPYHHLKWIPAKS